MANFMEIGEIAADCCCCCCIIGHEDIFQWLCCNLLSVIFVLTFDPCESKATQKMGVVRMNDRRQRQKTDLGLTNEDKNSTKW